jgi:hypothetical protein
MPKSAPERLTASIATGEIGVPERCVHIGDRASDIYEFFCLAQDLGANFLVRNCVDHLAEACGTTIAQVMQDTPPSGMCQIRLWDASGRDQQAHLVVNFATMVVRPPIGKQKFYAYQTFRIVHAEGPARRRTGGPCSGSRSPTSRPRSMPMRSTSPAGMSALEHRHLLQVAQPCKTFSLAPPRSVRSASKIASMRFTASSVVARSTAPERGRRHAGIRSSRSTRLNGGPVA